MLVNGTRGKITAAGQRHMGTAKPAKLNTHQIIAGTHLADQFRIGLGIVHIGTVDFNHTVLHTVNQSAHTLDHIEQNTDIGNIRYVFNSALAIHQKSCRQDSHSRVFRAADGNLSIQGDAAVDYISSQGISSPCKFSSLHPLLYHKTLIM